MLKLVQNYEHATSEKTLMITKTYNSKVHETPKSAVVSLRLYTYKQLEIFGYTFI